VHSFPAFPPGVEYRGARRAPRLNRLTQGLPPIRLSRARLPRGRKAAQQRPMLKANGE